MTTLTDSYPSRTGTAPSPAILPRKDPVIWTTDSTSLAKGPLTTQQIREFSDHGFLFLDSLFSDLEVQQLRTELNALAAQPQICASPACILEPNGNAVRSIFHVHRHSRVFESLAADRRLLGAAEQILGDLVYVHQSRVNFKPGFRGEEFYWHSDFETWHMEDGMPRMRAVSFSLLLTENNAFNGPLMLIPGSHRKFVACAGQTPADHFQHSLRKQEIGIPDDESLRTLVNEGGIVAPCGKAGSLLIFDCNIMHGSAGNLSPWPRSNVFIVLNSFENRLGTPFCGMPPRPEFIAAREVDQPETIAAHAATR